MGITFTPKTDKEIAEENLWPIGLYSFEIPSAEDFISKASNKMIKLTLNVYNDEGHCRILSDYLSPVIMFKLKHCSDVCGLEAEYEAGALEPFMFEGKTGTLKLGIKKDKNGQYPDQNSIADYVVNKDDPKPSAHLSAKANGFKNEEIDDEIPF